MNALKNILARRAFGPFNEKGTPGDRLSFRIDTAARAYHWNRRVRHMPAAKALEIAAPYVNRDYSKRPPQWFGNRGGAGAIMESNGERSRWIESTEHMGLRFVGWADEINKRIGHTGWHCDSEGWESLRGGVWQLPGRKGQARLVYGYVEQDNGKETNPGSACINLEIISIDMRAAEYSVDISDESACHDAARWADSMAESDAEDRRDFRTGYDAGREAAEASAEAIEARREALPLIVEYKAATASGIGPSAIPIDGPIARQAFQNIRAAIATIESARAKRDSSWRDCSSSYESSWLAGFIDNLPAADYRAAMIAMGLRAKLKESANA